MTVETRVQDLVTPIVESLELELVDVVCGGGRVKVTVDHPAGLGTALLSRATRLISHELDSHDPIPGSYTLEVSSPGVERVLRRPENFERSIGETVSVKLAHGSDGSTERLGPADEPAPDGSRRRRLKGKLILADQQGITIRADGDEHRIVYDQVAKAKTVFDWEPGPKPGKAKKG